MTLLDAVRPEVDDLPDFLVARSNGDCPNQAEVFAAPFPPRLVPDFPNEDEVFEHHFTRRFDPDFIITVPSGTSIAFDALTASLKAGWGKSAGFAIDIEDVQIRAAGADLVVVTYVERQRDASKTPDTETARMSMAALRVHEGGFLWLHLQETWLG